MFSLESCLRGLAVVTIASLAGRATGEVMTKPQVANLIVKVENGVDNFRDYLEKRGENARSGASNGASTQPTPSL